MTLLDIMTDKIQGNRKAHYVEKKDLSYNLGLKKPQEIAEKHIYNSPPIADNYLIFGIGKTSGEAIENFWLDYEQKGPYKEGDIFWRRMPEMVIEEDFEERQQKYIIRCRFSILPDS